MKALIKILPVFAFLAMVFGTNTVLAQDAEYTTVKIKTSAICGMCKDRLEHNMKFEKGVKDVHLDLKTKELTIVFKSKKNNLENLRKAITKIGYSADGVPADKKAFDKLEGCCKKEGACGADEG